MKNDEVMSIRRSRKKVAVSLLTSNLFCPSFALRLIGRPNKKSIGLKMTILAPEKPQKWTYLNSRFFQSEKVSVTKRLITQSLVTSTKINFFP